MSGLLIKDNALVYDNFLENRAFEYIESQVTNPGNLPFYIHDGVTGDGDGDAFLGHTIYKDNEVKSEEPYKFIKQEIFPKLNVGIFLRSKVNCYPKTHEVHEHKLHVDYPFPHKTALLSINTCNGYTLLEDGTKLESIRNRMVVFDGDTLHASTTCSDKMFRFNIIFNYIEKSQLDGWLS
jgi:hypothetical protein